MLLKIKSTTSSKTQRKSTPWDLSVILMYPETMNIDLNLICFTKIYEIITIIHYTFSYTWDFTHEYLFVVWRCNIKRTVCFRIHPYLHAVIKGIVTSVKVIKSNYKTITPFLKKTLVIFNVWITCKCVNWNCG